MLRKMIYLGAGGAGKEIEGDVIYKKISVVFFYIITFLIVMLLNEPQNSKHSQCKCNF